MNARHFTVLIVCFLMYGCATADNASGFDNSRFRNKTVSTFIVLDIVKELGEKNEGDICEFEIEDIDFLVLDLQSWCDLTGNILVSSVSTNNARRVSIKKGIQGESGKRMSVIISTDGLLETLSPLGFALAAQLSGVEVSVYFQGEGVKILKKGHKQNITDPIGSVFSGFARKGLNEIGHVSAQEKIVELNELGGRIFVCGPSMSQFKVSRQDLIILDVMVSEYFTFMKYLIKSDFQIYL